MKPTLIVLDDWEGLIAQNTCWDKLKEILNIQFFKEPIDRMPDNVLADAWYLMTIRERTALTREVFVRMPALKLILQTGGHAYHIDQTEVQNRNILIALGRRINAPLVSVPELTIAMMLSAVHKLSQAQQAIRTGKWPLLTGKTLNGRRLGILGMGRHGSRVAHIAKTAFNMEVVAWKRSGVDNSPGGDYPRLHLDELLATSDIISLHLRLSEESKGLMNKEKLQKMKPGAILINTSRGEIVDEQALIDLLKSGHLSTAGLDVFNKEPLPVDSPLRMMDNVILSPHIGWTVEEVFQEFSEIACTQLNQYLLGKLPQSELLEFALNKH